MKKCCNRLRLRAGVSMKIYRLRLRLRSKLPTPVDSDSDSDSAALMKSVQGTIKTGADPGGGVTWVMTLPLGPGAPQACQGHHRLSRGTTKFPRDTTYLLVRVTTGLAVAPVIGTTGLPGAPRAPPVQPGHHRPARGRFEKNENRAPPK